MYKTNWKCCVFVQFINKILLCKTLTLIKTRSKVENVLNVKEIEGYECHSCQKSWSRLKAARLSLCWGHRDLCFAPRKHTNTRGCESCGHCSNWCMSRCENMSWWLCALQIWAVWSHPEPSLCSVLHFLQPSWPQSASPWKTQTKSVT